jgi:type IV secretory pathway VirB10-like protein
VTVKCNFEGDVRMLRVATNITLEEFRAAILLKFNRPAALFKFQDPSGDFVALDCQDDLDIAFDFAKDFKNVIHIALSALSSAPRVEVALPELPVIPPAPVPAPPPPPPPPPPATAAPILQSTARLRQHTVVAPLEPASSSSGLDLLSIQRSRAHLKSAPKRADSKDFGDPTDQLVQLRAGRSRLKKASERVVRQATIRDLTVGESMLASLVSALSDRRTFIREDGEAAADQETWSDDD